MTRVALVSFGSASRAGVRTVRKAVDAEGGGESHELVQLVRLERALRVSNGLGTVSARSVGSREARGDHDRSKIVAFSTVEVRCRSGGKDRDARARVFDAPRAATCRGRRPTAGISPRGCSPGRPSWPPSRLERGGSLANALGLERFRAVWRWRELVSAAARSAAGSRSPPVDSVFGAVILYEGTKVVY